MTDSVQSEQQARETHQVKPTTPQPRPASFVPGDVLRAATAHDAMTSLAGNRLPGAFETPNGHPVEYCFNLADRKPPIPAEMQRGGTINALALFEPRREDHRMTNVSIMHYIGPGHPEVARGLRRDTVFSQVTDALGISLGVNNTGKIDGIQLGNFDIDTGRIHLGRPESAAEIDALLRSLVDSVPPNLFASERGVVPITWVQRDGKVGYVGYDLATETFRKLDDTPDADGQTEWQRLTTKSFSGTQQLGK